MPMNNPVPDAVASHWDDLLDDARATATEYSDRGWDVLLLHTADATVVDKGLSVLVPDNEFEKLTPLADGLDFDTSRAFATTAGGVRFVLIIVEATADDQAVAVPAYFHLSEKQTLREQGQEAGELSTRVRALGADSYVTFTHEDPTLFLSE